ncbi:hypothetical protein HN51_023996 [Arachis hypogaea]|uniref:Uncharacterized protein n=1 Tax=Arachis hypogaea TaxID=3818 RepID=A0A445C464_ARAHY|nr:hypothetical protein Ahy_A07g031537 [Arachis hypogaea]
MASLCEDELLHIFSFLPTKSICKFQSLCKSLHDKLRGARFRMNHAQNMSLKNDTYIFIQPRIFFNNFDKDELFHLLPPPPLSSPTGEELNFHEQLPKNFLQFLKKVKILASSNGLILCQSNSNKELCLCNPITQTWLPITTPSTMPENPFHEANVFFKCMNNKGLEYLDDYLIILIEGTPEWGQHVIIKLYSSKEGVWRKMENDFFVGPMNMRLNNSVYLQKKLFLISNSPSVFKKGSHYLPLYIMAYDFAVGGESTTVNLPEDTLEASLDWNCDLRIFEWGKEKSLDHSLCLVRYIKGSFTIWILIDSKSSKWKRILEVKVEEIGLKEENPNVQEFRIVNGNCLVFVTGRKVYGYYCFNDQSCWELKEICEHKWDNIRINLIPYSPTLRSCGSNMA